MNTICRSVALVALLLWLVACTVDQETAEEVLADEGYHDVELTGWAPMSCSDDDTFKSHFRARRTVTEPDGSRHERVVEGTICCGWLKDCTVRH